MDDDFFAGIEEELSGAYEGPGRLPIPYCQWLADFDEIDAEDEEEQEHQVYKCAGLALHHAECFAVKLEMLWKLHRKLRTGAAFEEEELVLDGPTGKVMLGKLLEELSSGRHVDGLDVKLISDDPRRDWDEARQLRNDLCHGFFTRQTDLKSRKGKRRACEDLLRMADALEEAASSVDFMGGILIGTLNVSRKVLKEHRAGAKSDLRKPKPSS